MQWHQIHLTRYETKIQVPKLHYAPCNKDVDEHASSIRPEKLCFVRLRGCRIYICKRVQGAFVPKHVINLETTFSKWMLTTRIKERI